MRLGGVGNAVARTNGVERAIDLGQHHPVMIGEHFGETAQLPVMLQPARTNPLPGAIRDASQQRGGALDRVDLASTGPQR